MDLHAVAAMCNGYVGADIQALCREAAMSALQNSLQCKGEERLKSVGMEDWQEAHRKVGPSIVRGAAAEIPQVSWEDIGGLHEVKVHTVVDSGYPFTNRPCAQFGCTNRSFQEHCVSAKGSEGHKITITTFSKIVCW